MNYDLNLQGSEETSAVETTEIWPLRSLLLKQAVIINIKVLDFVAYHALRYAKFL